MVRKDVPQKNHPAHADAAVERRRGDPLLRISAIQAIYNAKAYCRNFDQLTAPQQMALSQLVFQMGTNLEEFVEFLGALKAIRTRGRLLHLLDYDVLLAEVTPLAGTSWNSSLRSRIDFNLRFCSAMSLLTSQTSRVASCHRTARARSCIRWQSFRSRNVPGASLN